jgi:two-component system, chemotaxis family, protein-glutamate methylesterase/glutaminase
VSEAKPRIRVLVVDDSAFARQVVRRVLERGGDIEVVGIAADGAEALEKIAHLAPDVITLDLVMPHVDGLGVLAALPPEGGPRVVVVSSVGMSSELGAAALAAGAVELVEKPTTQATDRLYEMAQALVQAVRFAATVRAMPRGVARPVASPPARAPAPVSAPRIDAVLVGASTGGPQAIAHVLPRLPAELPVPVVVVLHMPAGYVDGLARRLDRMCALTVLEGHEGLLLARGMVVLAPAGAHAVLERTSAGLELQLDYVRRGGELHQPSVDALLTSGAAVLGSRALGVVLTGMGNDGLAGARALVQAGARVIVQAESSCVVYGMPRAIVEAGLADEVLELDQIADAIGSRAGLRS